MAENISVAGKNGVLQIKYPQEGRRASETDPGKSLNVSHNQRGQLVALLFRSKELESLASLQLAKQICQPPKLSILDNKCCAQ